MDLTWECNCGALNKASDGYCWKCRMCIDDVGIEKK